MNYEIPIAKSGTEKRGEKRRRRGGRDKGESGETGGDEGRQNYRGEERRGETNYLVLCAVECHAFVCVCVLLCACSHGAAYYSTNTDMNLLLPLLLSSPPSSPSSYR